MHIEGNLYHQVYPWQASEMHYYSYPRPMIECSDTRKSVCKEKYVAFAGLKMNQVVEWCRKKVAESNIAVQPSSCGGRREVADEGRGLAGVGVINVQKMNWTEQCAEKMWALIARWPLTVIWLLCWECQPALIPMLDHKHCAAMPLCRESREGKNRKRKCDSCSIVRW